MLETSRRKAVELLRQHGLRCGGPRVEVLALMIEAHCPVSAQDLIDRLGSSDMNEATIYRTLNTLTIAGISIPVDSPGRKRLYEVHADADCRDAHVHFVCRGCGGVSCLEDLEGPQLEPPPVAGGYRVEHQRLYLYGSCPQCHEVST